MGKKTAASCPMIAKAERLAALDGSSAIAVASLMMRSNPASIGFARMLAAMRSLVPGDLLR
jgi:hypothetical protein